VRTKPVILRPSLHSLARIVSSDKADVLDVYYESPDGRWCLGGKFPIAKGWATYRLDLTKNSWWKTRSGDESRQWGGPSRRVRPLRSDPGNQADRWVAIDTVRLEPPAADFQEGVSVETQGTARMVGYQLDSRRRLSSRDRRGGNPLVCRLGRTLAQRRLGPRGRRPLRLCGFRPLFRGGTSPAKDSLRYCLEGETTT
jgi:hypothetical protein